MHYAQKINGVLKNPNLSENELRWVDVACVFAQRLGIGADMFGKVADGTVSESTLATAISAGVTLVEGSKSYIGLDRLPRDEFDNAETRTYHGEDPNNAPTRTFHGAGDRYENKWQSNEAEENHRAKYREDTGKDKKRLAGLERNRRAAVDPSGSLNKELNQHKTVLTKRLMAMPPAERIPETKRVIKKLLDVATTMTREMNTDWKGKWGLRDNLKAKIPDMAAKARNKTEPSTRFSESYVRTLNTAMAAMLVEATGLAPAPKRNRPSGDLTEVDTGSHNDDTIKGMVMSIRKSGIDPNTQGQILKQIVNDLLKGLALKIKEPDDQTTIEARVAENVKTALAKQEGEDEMSLTVKYGVMPRDKAKLVLTAYVKALKGLGLTHKTLNNPTAQQVEFVVTNPKKSKEPEGMSKTQKYHLKKFGKNQVREAKPGADGAPNDPRFLGVARTQKSNFVPIFQADGGFWAVGLTKEWMRLPDAVIRKLLDGGSKLNTFIAAS